MTIFKEFNFDSAHKLIYVPKDHKCGRLHGHTYHVHIEVTGRVSCAGWVQDYAEIAEAWQPLHEQLDHRYLNEIPGLENSTVEVLTQWIWVRLKPALPMLSKVCIRETCTAGCEYIGDEMQPTPKGSA